MDGIEYLGFVATSLGSLAFLPQVAKTLRTRSANDFSLVTLLMVMAGNGIWIFYGLSRNAPAIWLGNGVTVALLSVILLIKTKNLAAQSRPAQCPANL